MRANSAHNFGQLAEVCRPTTRNRATEFPVPGQEQGQRLLGELLVVGEPCERHQPVLLLLELTPHFARKKSPCCEGPWPPYSSQFHF